MAGIGVDTKLGPGWEYSLDNHTWQPGKLFLAQTDGTPFVPGDRYTVFARNPVLKVMGSKEIIFSRESSDPADMIDADQVFFNNPIVDITAFFMAGLGGKLPPEPDGALYPMLVQGPDGLFYVRTIATSREDSFSEFEHFIFVDDSAAQGSDWRVRLDSNSCAQNGQPGAVSGWGVDINHPLLTPSLRIMRNGVFEADVVATIDRPDVLNNFLKPQGLVPQSQTFCRYGYVYYKPDTTNNGQPITWDVFGGNTKATSDVGVAATVTCGTAPQTNNYRRSGPEAAIEGQPGVQLGLERQAGNGQWGVVANNLITYSTVGAPTGVTLSGSGLFAVAADSISQNGSVEVHAALWDRVIIFSQQILNVDCQRPAGLTTYILAWNFTPPGGFARSFSTLSDACNTVGGKLDNSAPGTLGTFYAQAEAIQVGKPFYAGTTNSCETVSERIYYVFQNGFIDSIKKMVEVKNGIITTVQPCTYNPCSSYHVLTPDEREALPQVIIYEYADPNTNPGNGLPSDVRAFASRSEAIQHLSTTVAQGSKANFDRNNCTTSSCSVGDVLYNDNRPEHYANQTNLFYPVEAGYWGFNRTLPLNGSPGQFTLIQTNACGQIVANEIIAIPAS